MANIKVPLSEDLKLCINDARLICECLNMAKTTLNLRSKKIRVSKYSYFLHL